MSKKKTFNVSAALSQGLQETINIIEHHSGDLRNVVIPLSRIEIDPLNPRQLSITADDIRMGLNKDDPLFEKKESERQALLSISKTIKNNGLLHPITVYKAGNNYRIIAGERRYLGSLLADMTEIDARVYNNKPEGLELRLIQWIENTTRQDLSLWERIVNIKEIIAEQQKQNPSIIPTATWLKDIVDLSLSQAAFYINVTNAPKDVMDAIEAGYINSLDRAAIIVEIEEPLKRLQAIEDCKAGVSLRDLRAEYSSARQNKDTSLKRSKNSTNLVLGSTKSSQVIKILVSSLLRAPEFEEYSHDFQNIRWKDPIESIRAFKKIIRIIEGKILNEQ